MKVLWVVNHLMKDIAEVEKKESPLSGSWLVKLSSELSQKNEINLHILIPWDGKNKRLSVNDITYHLINSSKRDRYINPTQKFTRLVKETIKEIRPDIIHLQGSEFAYNISFSEIDTVPVLTSIQGLISEIVKYDNSWAYINRQPYKSYSCSNPISIYGKEISKYLRNLFRAKAEIKHLEKCSYVIGRTNWDQAHSFSINNKSRYFFLQETIRDNFLIKKWNPDKMEKYTIFCAGGYSSPLKGAHIILEAAVILRKEFKDLKVRIVGENLYGIKKPKGYQRLILNQIKKNKLEKVVSFTGKLDAVGMAEEFCNANVYVMGSSIENSSNTLGEALSIGTPSVVPYVGGNPSIARDSIESLYYRFGDIQQLAWQIRRIFTENNLATYLSNNSIEKANQQYKNYEITKDLIQIYEKIIEDYKK